MASPQILRRIFLTAALFLGIFPFLFGAQVVHAFTVSPVIFDKTVDPGSNTQGVVHIVNDTNAPQTYYVTVQNFVPQGEEGQQTFLPSTDTVGLVSWIGLDRKVVSLKSGEGDDFRWSLNIPTKAEPGGHYAAIFFSTIPQNGTHASNVGVGAKTGVLFLVNVNGNIIERASVASFKVLKGGTPSQAMRANVIDHLPAFFELRIHNEGSVHFIPKGVITITNIFGNKLTDIGVDPAGSRVLPNSIRKVRSTWGGVMPAGNGFFAKLRAEWAGFAFGRYTATVHATYGTSHAPLTAQVSFWVIPWRLLIIGLLALILFILLVKGYNALVVRSAIRTSEKKKSKSKRRSISQHIRG